MNKIERIAYDWLKSRPLLKSRIVYLYQSAFRVVPQVPLKSTRPVVVRNGYFFGFHDKSPFSPDNERLLGHRNLIGNRSVVPGDLAEVGFFSGEGRTSLRPEPPARGTGSSARCSSGAATMAAAWSSTTSLKERSVREWSAQAARSSSHSSRQSCTYRPALRWLRHAASGEWGRQ